MLRHLLFFVCLLLASLSLAAESLHVGTWKITPLYDGYFDIDQKKLFVGIEPERLQKELEVSMQALVSDLTVRTQVLGFLVETGKALILIDTGCGTRCGPDCGFLCDSLQKVGYKPDQVTHILLTHLHGDHFGGLDHFPNAALYVDARDVAHFLDPVEQAKANPESRPWYAVAKELLTPFKTKGSLHLFGPGQEILPGVFTIEASGHTPGHTAFLFRSQGQEVLLWGDTVHSAAIQFANPDWYVIYDSDGPKAINSRKRLFAYAVEKKLLVGGAHLPHSGFGTITQEKDAFIWHPILFSGVQPVPGNDVGNLVGVAVEHHQPVKTHSHP